MKESVYVEVNTIKLVGAALDWAVAMCHGWEPDRPQEGQIRKGKEYRVCGYSGDPGKFGRIAYNPSTDWSRGGRLFDRYDLRILASDHCAPNGSHIRTVSLHRPNGHAAIYAPTFHGGPTILEAACRAVVFEEIGAVVSVPVQLSKLEWAPI